jgi:hypothetical protein
MAAPTDRSLRLKAIIRGRVDHIRAQFHRAHNRLGVAPISFFIGIAQIGADADRRELQVLRCAKVDRRPRFLKALAIFSVPCGEAQPDNGI